MAVHIILFERELDQVDVRGVVLDEHDFAVGHWVYSCFDVGSVK